MTRKSRSAGSCIPPDREPGTVSAYSQPCTYALASIIQRNAGMPLTRYLRPRLFDPLGIGHVGWHTFPPGREQGFSGLHARTEDIAKLGLLYLQGGQWEGAQLIGEKWVAEATSQQVANPAEPNPDWRQGYGFQFWMSRHGYRGDGAFGQFCVILPEQDTVIATTACTLDMQAVLDAMWDRLLPGLGRVSPGAAAAHDLLGARLARLELPCLLWACLLWACLLWHADTRRLGSVDQWAVHRRRRCRRHAGSALPDLHRGSAAGRRLADQPHRARQRADLSVGARAWTVSDHADRNGETIPVAASGGWLDGQTLRAEVIFLEAPHRMDVTCSLPGRIAEAVWRHPPLTPGKLQNLHCPQPGITRGAVAVS